MAGSSRLLCSPLPSSGSHSPGVCIPDDRISICCLLSLFCATYLRRLQLTLSVFSRRAPPSLISLFSLPQCPTSLHNNGILHFPSAAYVRRIPGSTSTGHVPNGKSSLATQCMPRLMGSIYRMRITPLSTHRYHTSTPDTTCTTDTPCTLRIPSKLGSRCTCRRSLLLPTRFLSLLPRHLRAILTTHPPSLYMRLSPSLLTARLYLPPLHCRTQPAMAFRQRKQPRNRLFHCRK